MSKELEVVAYLSVPHGDRKELLTNLRFSPSAYADWFTDFPLVKLSDAKSERAAAERILRMYADAPEGSIGGEFARGYFGP